MEYENIIMHVTSIALLLLGPDHPDLGGRECKIVVDKHLNS